MPTIETINPPAGMLVRFISDLHYGHERCEAPSPAELAARMTQGGVGMLVVVGDVAETRQCAWQAEGMRLREELREVALWGLICPFRDKCHKSYSQCE